MDDVAHIAFLARIRRLFAAPSPHLGFIADPFTRGDLQHPAEPMSDQELARAIREFRNMPLSAASLNKLGCRFAARKPSVRARPRPEITSGQSWRAPDPRAGKAF
jgi:hypothetical protein